MFFMREQFRLYILNLYNYLPAEVFGWFFWVFCLGTLLMLAIFDLKRGVRYSSRLLLVEYIGLIISSTIVFRNYREPAGINLMPFWSYKAIIEGQTQLIYGSIMNVLVFVPLGLLLGIAFKRMNWRKAFWTCTSISIMIETLQFVFERGFTEFDDLVHNVAGGMIGYGLYVGMVRMAKKISTIELIAK